MAVSSDSVRDRAAWTSARLMDALSNPHVFPHPVTTLEIVETHISWVILTGEYVYKVKKPVNLGFLDFSSLEKRRHFCEEEVRINARLAPQIYLDVVTITGSADSPQINGRGPVIEYAVRMRQFPQENQLDRLIERGELAAEQITELAKQVAYFHQHVAAVAVDDTDFGTPSRVQHPMDENFRQIAQIISEPGDRAALKDLRDWSNAEFLRQTDRFLARKRDGRIRECHGDLHLGNIAYVEGAPLLFDAIEFNDELRWIDVMSDVAFLVMDLYKRGHPNFAFLFLNTYLEETGDYEGLAVLPYYLVYRALVRAKVDCIRAHQAGVDRAHQQQIMDDYHAYIDLAQHFVSTDNTTLFITHGLSGSGKTTVAGQFAGVWPAIRLRSDVERKRLFGLRADADSESKLDAGLYSHEATERTYTYLLEQSGHILDANLSVIVDASFLDGKLRNRFANLAREKGVRFAILHCEAAPDQLEGRIVKRRHAGTDASEANLDVLNRQRATQDPLTDEEQKRCTVIDTGAQIDYSELRRVLLN